MPETMNDAEFFEAIPRLDDSTIEQVNGKKVVLRLDLNDGIDAEGNLTSTARTDASIPTIVQLVQAGAEEIHILAHRSQKLESLSPVADYLQQQLQAVEVTFHASPQGTGKPRTKVNLYDNIRIDQREKSETASERAALAEEIMTGINPDSEDIVYVNDAFGAAHRAHASMVELAQQSEVAMAGPLMSSELEKTAPFRDPEVLKQTTVFVGGSKIEDKVAVLEYFAQTTKCIVPGGAILNAFLAARGHKVENSYGGDEASVQKAQEILALAEEHGCDIQLPLDMVAAPSDKDIKSLTPDDLKTIVLEEDVIPEGMAFLDLGPETCGAYQTLAQTADAIVCNGAPGVGDLNPHLDKGTMAVFTGIAQNKAAKHILVGGGSANDAAARLEEKTEFSIPKEKMSTGGGALLQLLAKGPQGMPALVALKVDKVLGEG